MLTQIPKDVIFPGDRVMAGMAMARHEEEIFRAPHWMADVECVNPQGKVWEDKWSNSVQFQGKVDLMNRYFGAANAASNSVWYIGLHNANATFSTASSLSNVTASEVGGYAAARASITIASNFTTQLYTTTASFGFTSSTYTVSGLMVCGQLAGSTASATAGTQGLIYSMGNFNAGSRQVQSADTLNVTLTLSMG